MSTPLVADFAPIQNQNFDSTKETADEYHKRGGVTHFIPKSGPHALCRSSEGQAGIRVWKHVNCLTCFRARAELRKAIDASKPKAPRGNHPGRIGA